MAGSAPQPVPEGLRPLELRCGDVWEMELFRECGCGCLACRHGRPEEAASQASFDDYARGNRGFGSVDGLGLNRRLPDQLEAWVHTLGDERPPYVTLGIVAEPLPGSSEAEEVLEQSLRILQRASVGVSLQTRRLIPERILDTLAELAPGVRVTVPLPSLFDDELKQWEPGTALSNQRLWNLQQLRLRRVPVTLSIKPLIPYVNDDRAHLAPLIGALADLGGRRLTAEFMRLTSSVRARLEARSPVSTRLIFGAYTSRELDERQDHTRPNLERRRRVYGLISGLAAERRVRFSLCRCADPVLGRQACQFWPGDAQTPSASDATPTPTPTPRSRSERVRTRRRSGLAASQVGFSDILNTKQ